MSHFRKYYPPHHIVRDAVSRALSEDLGRRGDITTNSVISTKAEGSWIISAREKGVISGLDCVHEVFFNLDNRIEVNAACEDGAQVEAGTIIVRINGFVRPVLTGERTALNFLGHLSGIASLTERYGALTAGTKANIVCTRKTTPGLRVLEKYAVLAGGGHNHRFGLDDAVLIKDNHIAAAGGITCAIKAAQAHAGHLVQIEVEVDTIDQLEEALGAGAAIILLDNMSIDDLTQAVHINQGRATLEASGGINEHTCQEIAQTGIDIISVGRLTHSAPTLDLGLDTT
jgi:nicotinate-nucleotide pyrophosphorylase (carboxylating)